MSDTGSIDQLRQILIQRYRIQRSLRLALWIGAAATLVLVTLRKQGV